MFFKRKRERKRLRVVVHAGMHKTGTSTLQVLLDRNRRRLGRAGICYPRLAETHHEILGAHAWTADGCGKALEEAHRIGAHTLILSSETVSTRSEQHFRKLTESFAGHDLTYLFCLRHWRSYFPSRWSQNCSRRDTQSLGAYVETVTGGGSQHPDFRFDLVLDRAASSGACSVQVVSYDNAMAADGSVVPALLRTAGLSDDVIARLRHDDFQNTRNDVMLVELCRLLNGVVAERRALPQDDLFHAVREHRRCNGFFDLPPAIAKLRAPLRDEMLALIASHGFKTWECPDVRDPQEALARKHAVRFVNRIDGELFVEKPSRPVRFSELDWRTFRTAIGDARLAFHSTVLLLHGSACYAWEVIGPFG